jgi:sulfate adenylyltransferase
MKHVTIDNKTISDLECIVDGYFLPLETFMKKDDWKKVCTTMHLDNGLFFPLPIVLAVDKDTIILNEGIILVDSTNFPLAVMTVTEIYEPDIDFECLNAYGTTDTNHPYVHYKQQHKGKHYISGPLKQLNKIRHYDFKNDRLLPKQTREYFKEKGWKTIVGFQTRNPMHRAHYELTQYALKKTGVNDSKLFLNPVVGETQMVDIEYFVRTKCYKEILKKYEEDQVLLGLLPLAMRMAGPREACLHALIRKNYGCTHFVVGRDHAGPSYKTKEGKSFYDPYEAQNLLQKHASEIGIVPIVSKKIVYNQTKNIYQPTDEVDKDNTILELSGTQQRALLRAGKEIPTWFSYPEIINILKSSIKKKGVCYSFIGLSGSGKTSAANILKIMILEEHCDKEITMLDGDIVRKHLSNGDFSKKGREINIRRIGYVASEIVKHGGIVICANISPYDYLRLENRKIVEDNGGTYIEIFVDPGLEVCEKRDVKGLYKLAREGKIKQFTGISDPFEEPSNSDLNIPNVESDENLDKLTELVSFI